MTPALPIGTVRKASISVSSKLLNVNASTGARRRPDSRSSFNVVSRCDAPFSATNRSGGAPGVESAYATRSRPADQPPTVPGSFTTDSETHSCRTAADRRGPQCHGTPLLHGEDQVRPAAIPLWRAMAVIDMRTDLTTATAVGVHDPHVRVLHRRFRRREWARGAGKRDRTTVRRPLRVVLGAPGVGHAAHTACARFDSEDVVVEEAIRIGLAIRDKGDLATLRGPVDRVLVVATKPRSHEVTKSQRHEATKPRSHNATKPRSHEVITPRSHEATKPRSHNATKPRSSRRVL